MNVLLLLLLLPIPCCVAGMTSMEARKELQLPDTYSEKELRSAYRKRAAETHPDKGGSTAEFLKVSEAYELLSSMKSGKHKSSFGMGKNEEELMRHAEMMFDFVMNELGEDLDTEVDNFNELIMDDINDSIEEYLGETGWKQWIVKGMVKFLSNGFFSVMGKMMIESEDMQVNISGQQVNAAELVNWWKKKKKMTKKGNDKPDKTNHEL
eukprot:gnl/MRDRNA2_/MRDRNA2_153031_c0_seq1.p1 gnl/MRDRNA2_/MRDRNA2_153031_c0~~gnl/MRDRNA2_/MRDRNA2_153031_c0_seq1.p1  ORF type:complete len:209 (-),score=51.20 gnl/MRDRNA2_/MRDRNA2_153031_c0_seq1:132-758(-)